MIELYGVPGTKNINKAKNEFTIIKKIGGKTVYLGRGKTLIIALMKRDWCEANNWKPYPIPRYCITKTNYGTFNLTKKKRINGTSNAIYSANFPTYEEAKKEAELLEKYDWDIERLCECEDEAKGNERWLEGVKMKSTFETMPRNDYFMAKRGGIL